MDILKPNWKMRNIPLVSIVMPVFNAEKYIEKTVTSILRQTTENIEIVIVDDCSTDKTWNILTKIAIKETRCRIYRLEKNTGSAKYPRDYAVLKSKGKFICWIDADDIVGENYIERLVQRQQSTQADIVCSKMVAFNENNDTVYTLPKEGFDYTQIINGKDAVMYTIGEKWDISVNGYLAKKELWCAAEHFLDKNVIQMNADDLGSREMLLNSEIVAFENVEYRYRLHSQAITKAISHKLFEPLITDKMVIDLFKRTFGYSSQTKAAWSQYFSHWIALMRIYVVKQKLLSIKSRNIAYNLLKEHKRNFKYNIIFSDRNFSLSRKLLLLSPFKVSMQIIKKINS